MVIEPATTVAVVVSGFWDRTLEEEARRNGAVYLLKPVSGERSSRLCSRCSRIAGRRRPPHKDSPGFRVAESQGRRRAGDRAPSTEFSIPLRKKPCKCLQAGDSPLASDQDQCLEEARTDGSPVNAMRVAWISVPAFTPPDSATCRSVASVWVSSNGSRDR